MNIKHSVNHHLDFLRVKIWTREGIDDVSSTSILVEQKFVPSFVNGVSKMIHRIHLPLCPLAGTLMPIAA